MRAWLLGMAAFAVACGGSDVGRSSAPIVGGDADTTSTNVVMVYIHAQQQGGGWVDCTGTVISPHVVLTAGHCLDLAMLGLGANPVVKIYAGKNIYETSALSDYFATAATVIDPLYAQVTVATKGHDVGVVVTEVALPFTPVPFVRTSLDDGALVGQSVRLVGYGLTDFADANSDGRRNSGTTTIASIDKISIATADQAPSGCEGDSGGPMLATIGGVETVVGVISHGNDAEHCQGASIAERVDLEASFLEPIVEQYDPGFLPVADAGSDADAGDDAGTQVDPSSASSCATSPRGDRAPFAFFALAALALVRVIRALAGRGSDRWLRR